MTKPNKISIVLMILLTGLSSLSTNLMASNSNDEWFDTYGVISWESEKLHLDNFGIYLKRNPDMNGYIGFYLGENADPTELAARMERSKKYLVCNLEIAERRVILINGGKRSETKIILQPITKDNPIPDFKS